MNNKELIAKALLIPDLPEDAVIQKEDGTYINLAGDVVSEEESMPLHVIREQVVYPFNFLRMQSTKALNSKDNSYRLDMEELLLDASKISDDAKFYPAISLDILDLDTHKDVPYERLRLLIREYKLLDMKVTKKFPQVYNTMRISKSLKFAPINIHALSKWLTPEEIVMVKESIERAYMLPKAVRFWVIGIITLYLCRLTSREDWNMLRSRFIQLFV